MGTTQRSLFITATDLKQWADTRDAQGDLPRLVRRLIHGTVRRVLRRSMPAGDSVQSGGWDGIVVVEGGNEFVPEGSSVWEFGAGKDPAGKAQEDYDKRTANPRGVDPQTSTFIFVTPRIWQGKDEWAIERMKEGKWLEVRAYDADDLERWLELAPAVQSWFAQYLNKLPEAATDLETFWRDWAEATKPALTPEFVLAGRQETATTVQRWLEGATSTLAVQAETPQEAIAAFAASILALPDDERLTWLARTAVVETAAAWTRLAVAPSGLFLIPLFDVGNLFARATRGGHRVLVPLGKADQTTAETLSPGPLGEKTAAKELVDLGLTPGRAWELAVMARRSMMAFRRAIAVRPEVQQPEWAKPAVARALLPALLAGAWQETHTGDRQAVASIAGSAYEGVQENMLRWANESDPPVRHVGETWYLVSAEDAWNLLSRYLTRDDLERFEAVAVDLLGTPDPRFDLPQKDWSAARALGATPLQSELLRRNIAEAIAMLATRGARLSIGLGITASDFAIRIVSKVLAKAHDDWRVWASLSDIKALPPLAEAAPDVFLAAVERGVAGDEPVLLRLFTDKDDAFFSRTQHTGLLNALEALAWSKDYFGRVTRLVAALARIDPGGKYANRPSATLLHFFWPEQPFTMAAADTRLAALDAILGRDREVGWIMLIDLFPHHFGRLSLMGTHPPQWLPVHPEQYERPSKQEVEATLLALGDRVVAAIAAEPRRAVEVIGILDRLPYRTRDEVLTRLESLAAKELAPADRLAVWTALRDYMQPYKRRGEGLPDDFARIDALYATLEPQVDADRVLWLFDAPAQFDEVEGSWEEKQRVLRARQRAALETIIPAGGIDAVLALIPRAGRSDVLGSVAGELELEDAVALRVAADSLASSDVVTLHFGRGFMSALIRTRGTEWAEAQLAAHSEWSPLLRAEVLTLFPQYRRAWTLLADESDDVRRLYWQRMETWALPANEIAAVAEGYLQAGRPYSLIDYLAEQARNAKRADVAHILPLVERAMKSTPAADKPSESFIYNLAELLTALGREATAEEESRVALLEWAVLPLLTRQQRPTEMLHREMNRNPGFFAEVVRAAHPRKREGDSPVFSEDDRLYVFAAHQLIASWRGIPYDERLAEWVRHAREALASDDLAEQGDQYIGVALSAAPLDADGTWPPRAVRDVIETVASESLDQGFAMGVRNARGMTWRGEFEGGVQERDLAAKYDAFAAAIAGAWGRTAALLRGLAKTYSAEARREDASAHLWRDLEI